MIKEKKLKIAILAGAIALTVSIHYGWVLQPLFGSSHWIHAIHSRLCYIPIVVAAAWFGLRGGLAAAAVISVLVLPYIFGGGQDAHNLAGELVELVFYFAIAALTGALVERELRIRKKHEEAQLQLERSHRLSLVGQMAASVAHEIKNPLASIKGAVEIISADDTPPAERDEFQDILAREIRRIDGTVTEFLEFARPRPPAFECMDLSETLRAALKQVETNLAAAGLRLVPRITDEVIVRGDREKIHQVILNLLINAIQASPAGAAIEVALDPIPVHEALLVIGDHGPGIKPEEKERIFEPFFTTKPSGTGLGLAIVKSIVERHGGRITVKSDPGQGATVFVTLPRYGE